MAEKQVVVAVLPSGLEIPQRRRVLEEQKPVLPPDGGLVGKGAKRCSSSIGAQGGTFRNAVSAGAGGRRCCTRRKRVGKRDRIRDHIRVSLVDARAEVEMHRNAFASQGYWIAIN